MGQPGVDDRGIYDDAMFLISGSTFKSFNANANPSISRAKIATLKAGNWWYRVGTHGLSKPFHKRYIALVQAEKVTVERDPVSAGKGKTEDTGYFGINIHRGGVNTTSSEGCLTIPPSQWGDFIGSVRSALLMAGATRVRVILVEQK